MAGLDPAAEPAGVERTVAHPHRADRGVRPDRPAGCPACAGRGRSRRAGRGRLQDRPASAHRRRRADLAAACALRDGGRPGAAAALPPGRAASPADRAGCSPGSTPSSRWTASCAGPRTSPASAPRRTSGSGPRPAGRSPRRGLPAASRQLVRLVRLPRPVPGGHGGGRAAPPVGRAGRQPADPEPAAPHGRSGGGSAGIAGACRRPATQHRRACVRRARSRRSYFAVRPRITAPGAAGADGAAP